MEDSINYEERQQLMNQIATFLKQKGFYAEQQPNKSIIRLYHEFNNVRYRCFIVVHFSIKEVFFYFVPPITIQEEFLLSIAEYTTRINCGMTTGNFELNFSNGEVNYKRTIRWRDELFEMNEIMDVLDSGVTLWAFYLEGLLAIVQDGFTAEEGYREVRG
jgi:hypothetical protein